MSQRCEHVREDGTRCKVTWGVNEANGLCLCHDPTRKTELAKARSAGGKRTAEKRRRIRIRTVAHEEAMDPPETIEDAARWAAWATWAVAVGELDARTAREIAGLTRVFVTAMEKGELASRIVKLERKYAEAVQAGKLRAGR